MDKFEEWCDEIEYLCVDYSKRDTLRRGWKAAFTNMQQWLVGRRCVGEDVLDYVNKELEI